MKDEIITAIDNGIIALEQLKTPRGLEFIHQAARIIADAFKNGNKVVIAGNGGSLCDAAHFAEELTGQFRSFRPALPAIALTEPGHITCCANDFGFDRVFSRGVEAYGKPGDVFVGLTTSGNSPNIINAIEAAKNLEMATITFLGKSGGKLKGVADQELLIEGETSDRIQEAHMTAIHIIIECVEQMLFVAPQQEQAIFENSVTLS
ncbi:MAG: D-sedoheptulose-7-phosphate isomerase [Chlamydiota bacterium]